METTTTTKQHLASDPNSPAYECESYRRQRTELQIVHDFVKGTRHLRQSECASQYLLRFPREEQPEYDYRCKQLLIFNDTERTLAQLVGRVLRKPPDFEQDVPEQIRGTEKVEGQDQRETPATEGWGENMDLAGNHWRVLAARAFEYAVRDGHSFLFVDSPPREAVQPADGEKITLEDEQRAGVRPYWVVLEKSQVINWATANINGRTVLTRATIRECTTEPDGAFGEKEVVRYRVLTPGQAEIFTEVKDTRGNITLSTGKAYATDLDDIPLVPIYAKQTGYFESFPLLEPLAQIECSRMNLYSDYRVGIHLTIPILGVHTDDTNYKFQATGWHTFVRTEKGGSLSYAESSGNGLAYFERELAALDQRAAVFGLALLTTPTGPKTATEIQSGDLKSDAPLIKAAQGLQDGLERALSFTAEYGSLPTGGSIKLGFLTEKIPTLSPQALQALTGLAERGLLDKQTLLEILKHDGWLLDSQDVAALLQRLEEAEQRAADQAAALFNRGGLPVDPPAIG